MNSPLDHLTDSLAPIWNSIPKFPALHTYTNLSPLQLCIVSIAFNPIFWNVVAQSEYRMHLGRNVLGPRLACYLLAVTIFVLGLVRDHIYYHALAEQSPSPFLLSLPHKLIGSVLFLIGNVLVVSSMWALGVTGTYLGDYFGILMESRVTGFPFNVTNNPMYYGSFLSFLGTAIFEAKAVGIALSGLVLIMYMLALVSWHSFKHDFRLTIPSASKSHTRPRFTLDESAHAARRVSRTTGVLRINKSLRSKSIRLSFHSPCVNMRSIVYRLGRCM